MKTELLKSQWHRDCHPVYAGVYERAASGFYAMYTGSLWKISATSISEAALMPYISNYQHNEPWRGLIDKP